MRTRISAVSVLLFGLIGLGGFCISAGASAQGGRIVNDLDVVGRTPEALCRERLVNGRVVNPAIERKYKECVEAEREKVRLAAQKMREAERAELARRSRPTEPDSDCSVNIQHLTKYGYSSNGSGFLAIRATGTYRIGNKVGKFSIIDDDGLFTLAAVVNRWQSQGLLNTDSQTEKLYPYSDFSLALEAADLGNRYYRNISPAYSLRRQGESQKDYQARQDQLADRWRYTKEVGQYARSKIEAASPNTNFPADINQTAFTMATFLERFANPLSVAVYTDLEQPGRLLRLCQPNDTTPGSSNLLLGTLMCSREFLLNSRRDESICAKGVLFSPLPKLCDASAGENCAFGAPKTP